ncbi:phosphoglycerate mutase-like protein [Apiospora arundinis]
MESVQKTLLPMAGHRQLLHRLRLPYLLVVPALLAIATVALLGFHSDLNIAALYSQCHARSRLRWLSRIPLIGAPSCFLVSFFQLAVGGDGGSGHSLRAFAIMSVILSFIAALLTANLVESARLCNRRSWLIAKPTVPWLVFNLVGGALVWDLVIVPEFLRRAKDVQAAKESVAAERLRDVDSVIDLEVRCLTSQVEVFAIPLAVLFGFVAPSLAMLVTAGHPIAVIVWLFFPLWVSLVRYAVKVVGVNAIRDPEPHRLESNRVSLALVYAVPVLCSIMSHVLLVVNLFRPDDRREMTRATIKFIQIDFLLIGATVLYWLLVEAGMLTTLVMIVSSVILGPGAGLSGAWLLREKAIERYPDGDNGEHAAEDQPEHDEQSPLLGR